MSTLLDDDARSDVSSVLSDAEDLEQLDNEAKATSVKSPLPTNRSSGPAPLKDCAQTTHARVDARNSTQHETPRATVPRAAPPAKAKTPAKPQLSSAIELWRADCGICEEDAPDAWKALDSAERQRYEARDSKRRGVRFDDDDGAANRKPKKKRAKVVPTVAGKPVLATDPAPAARSTDSVPCAQATSTTRKVAINPRDRHSRGRFIANLLANGWSVSSTATKKTFWRPGRPPIAFDSLTQVARAFPELVPDA